jgi:aspartate racemase
LGGTSWESTAEYYRLLNQRTNAILGGVSTAQLLLWSFDFGNILCLKQTREFHKIHEMFEHAAKRLASNGAEILAICSNSGHQRADAVASASGLPLVHIVDSVGAELRRLGAKTVGLLGTIETMQGTFYKDLLKQRFGVTVIVPTAAAQERVDHIALCEISRGIQLESSKTELMTTIDKLENAGADAVILGCTELPLLIGRTPCRVPTLDTISLHVDGIIEIARTDRSEKSTIS